MSIADFIVMAAVLGLAFYILYRHFFGKSAGSSCHGCDMDGPDGCKKL